MYFFTLVVGYFANAQYDALFLLVFARKRSDEAISREGEFPQSMYLFTLVVGYFAYAQYDVLFLLPPKEEAIYLSLRGSNATAAIPMKKCAFYFKGSPR